VSRLPLRLGLAARYYAVGLSAIAKAKALFRRAKEG
jgi:hypothetical protein